MLNQPHKYLVLSIKVLIRIYTMIQLMVFKIFNRFKLFTDIQD